MSKDGPYQVADITRVLTFIRAALIPDGNDVERVGDVLLMPHQMEAVRFLLRALERYAGAVLADPVGTGKTWSALGVATFYEKLLVVAPASLRSMWTRALKSARRSAEFVSYESLSRAGVLTGADTRFELVIADEAHHLRNATTRRYRALAELTWGANVLLLSATPIHNRADELRTLASLFLGSGAWSLSPELLGRLICRRSEPAASRSMPKASGVRWISVADSNDILPHILNLPPPVPPTDGDEAVVLGTYVLVRQWCSSDAALVAALQRRLVAGQTMSHRLSQGHLPTRGELARWMSDSAAVQLALDLEAPDTRLSDASLILTRLNEHLSAVRALRDAVRSDMRRDSARCTALLEVLSRGHRAVLFTHSVDTAAMWFARLLHRLRVALLDGRGARIASGKVGREQVIESFGPRATTRSRGHAAADPMRIDVLIATDVLSEGVGLHDADVVVHLDLPWTVARLEQRVGRLRRIGSPHDTIQQYALEPPRGGNNALRLVERLATKARISETLIGISESRHSLAVRRSEHSPAEAHEQMVRLARGWNLPAQDPSHSGPLVAACTATTSGTTGFIAVVNDNAMLSLIGVDGGAITSSPTQLLTLLQRVQQSSIAPSDESVNRALALVHTWLETHRASEELLGGVTMQSDAHRRLLRLLNSSLRLTTRGTRRVTATHVTALRETLRNTRGIGSEYFLTQWLEDHPRPSHQDLVELTTRLSQRSGNARVANKGPQLEAILLILPPPP